MKTIFLVQPGEAELARTMERKLLALPRGSGVLFVGVSVDPARPEEEIPATYRIWIGCDRMFEESLMGPLVQVTLREEIARGVQISVEAHRGLDRQAYLKSS